MKHLITYVETDLLHDTTKMVINKIKRYDFGNSRVGLQTNLLLRHMYAKMVKVQSTDNYSCRLYNIWNTHTSSINEP